MADPAPALRRLPPYVLSCNLRERAVASACCSSAHRVAMVGVRGPGNCRQDDVGSLICQRVHNRLLAYDRLPVVAFQGSVTRDRHPIVGSNTAKLESVPGKARRISRQMWKASRTWLMPAGRQSDCEEGAKGRTQQLLFLSVHVSLSLSLFVCLLHLYGHGDI